MYIEHTIYSVVWLVGRGGCASGPLRVEECCEQRHTKGLGVTDAPRAANNFR